MADTHETHGHSICRNCYGFFCPTKSGPSHPKYCPDCGACTWVYFDNTTFIAAAPSSRTRARLLFYLKEALRRSRRLEVDDVA